MTSSATKPVVLVLTVLSHGLLPVPAKKTALYTGNDPDSCTGVEGLVTSKGYPFEKHSVVTSDGYVIEMHRIPRGRDGCASPCHGHPILLMSGLLGDSSNWVLDFPKQSLGFVLADRGYDVWMGNVRGSTYGKQHKSLQVQSKEFWNFTFHEHAILDLPAQIDYVLEFTGTKAVPYVGVSQGTLIFFTMMSERPEYNQKVKVFGALAPFNKLAHMDVAVLATFAPYTRKYLSAAYDKLMFGVLPSTFFPMPLVRTFCALPTRKLCASIGDSFMNFGAKYVNQSRFPVYLCHIPAGTSMKNVLHYAQLVTSKEAIMFDYGKEKNVRIYGQEEPRQYNIKNVQTDVGIFWSRGDQLVTPDNVRELIRNLGAHVKLDYFIDDPYYTHPHFNVAIHNEDVLYPVLVPFLDRYVTSA